jgi:hypothetical protein
MADRLDVFRRDISVFVQDNLSVEARKKKIADMARKALAETKAHNEKIVGHETPYDQIVDGRKDAPLESVNPNNGTIVFLFELGTDVLRWIGEQLVLHSPIKDPPIHYKDSHILLADGVQIDLGEQIPIAETYTFVNIVPYARKIERGESAQAPDGVYEVVADMARRRFGNIAQIRFTHVSTIPGGVRTWTKDMERASRNPAIVVTLR